MKNQCYCLILASAILLVTGSCNKEENVTVTAPSLSVSTAILTASSEGGTYGFDCKVTNPASDGSLGCTADVDWISDFSVAASGNVTFSVSATTSEDTRRGNITVSYISGYGSAEAVVYVAQNGGDSPILTIQPIAVTASEDGGVYEFYYSVGNSASDGEITCSAAEDWVNGFDYSEEGTVSFDVDKNGTGLLRTCEIAVSYSYSGGTVEETVTVVQDHIGSGNTGNTYADLVGTYEASGYGYVSNALAGAKTWTLKIYADGDDGIIIDGLVPDVAGTYPGTEAYIARATLNSAGQIVIPSQLTGYMYNSYYIGWTPCVLYIEGTGWSNYLTGPDCLFTYNYVTGLWTSDYGEFLGLFASPYSWTLGSFLDVTNPGITLRKTSSSTSSVTESSSMDLQAHTEVFSE